MLVTVGCPHCGRTVTLPQENLGTPSRCPHPQCGRRFTPERKEPAPAAVPQPQPAAVVEPERTVELPFALAEESRSVPVDDPNPEPPPPPKPLPPARRDPSRGAPPVREPSRPAASAAAPVREPSRGSGGGREASRGNATAGREPVRESSRSGPPASRSSRAPASAASDRERSVAKRGEGRASAGAPATPARRERPTSVALLAGFVAAVAAGALAGSLRFSLPLPVVLTMLSGVGVGVGIAFGAGGRGSGPRWGLILQSVTLGCAAGLWSWVVLFLLVQNDIKSFARDKIPAMNEWRDRVSGAFPAAFDFRRNFLALRAAGTDEELDQEITRFSDQLLMQLGGQNLSNWQKNPVIKANRADGGFGDDVEKFKHWCRKAFRAKMRGNSRFEGGRLEPRGGLLYLLLAAEIGLAGGAACLTYLQLVGRGGRPDDEPAAA